MKCLVDVRSDSSIGNSANSPGKASENRWRWDISDKDCQSKVPSIGPSGEKTFTVREIVMDNFSNSPCDFVDVSDTNNLLLLNSLS